MQIFYTPDIKGKEYILNETESKHCVRVLRKNKGDIIHLTDGKGYLYQAKIVDDNPKKCHLIVVEKQENKETKPFYLHLAVAPTKNIERFEWFLEKVTEIGVDEITPLLCENSERKSIKPERLEKIMVSAMKQSLKSTLPVLNEMTKYEKFISKMDDTAVSCIAHCNANEKRHPLKAIILNKQKITILIGPEGDFSKKEIELAVEKGVIAVSMGESRLRTETAGVAACHTVHIMNC